MSNSADSSIYTSQKPQSVHVDALEGELNRKYSDQAVEIAALRKRENALRSELEMREQDCFDQERRLEEAEASIDSLKRTLADQQIAYDRLKEDLNRKLAKLTDENWAKDLENESLRTLNAAEATANRRLKDERDLYQNQLREMSERCQEHEAALARKEEDLQALKAERAQELESVRTNHQDEVDSLKRTQESLRSEIETERSGRLELQDKFEALRGEHEARLEEIENQRNELEQAHRLLGGLERAVESSSTELAEATTKVSELQNEVGRLTQQLSQQFEQARSREAQMIGEVARLRGDCSALEQHLREANTVTAELRQTLDAQRVQHEAEIREMETEAQRGLAALKAKLQEEFQNQFEPILAETKVLRQKLEVRETNTENDRKSLKQWQEQLNFLDQHLRQAKDTLKKDKAEVVRLAKQLAQELQGAGLHPFKDYLEFADTEIANLRVLFNNTSSLSPARPKLEERLAQMVEHREALNASLAEAQRVIGERVQAVVAIVKSANALV